MTKLEGAVRQAVERDQAAGSASDDGLNGTAQTAQPSLPYHFVEPTIRPWSTAVKFHIDRVLERGTCTQCCWEEFEDILREPESWDLQHDGGSSDADDAPVTGPPKLPGME